MRLLGVRAIFQLHASFTTKQSFFWELVPAERSILLVSGISTFGNTQLQDIRGYSQGQYRNDQVYTLQAEYRWNFYKRWSMVAFAGVASAVEKLADIPDNDLLPGVGAGIRFKMLPNEKINIGIDGAKGK